jgi:hypothetical protein
VASYVDIEVEPNPNSGDEELALRFQVHEAPRAVTEVRLGERVCQVTGWSPHGICPAVAQRVEDSGEGSVWLVRGGRWGLRLRPAEDAGRPWSLADARQWGEPCLKVANERDLVFA